MKLFTAIILTTLLKSLVLGACPNAVCEVETEDCLSCPQDCSCSFSGLRLDSWPCGPNSACNRISEFVLMPTISNFMPTESGAVTGRLSGYLQVDEVAHITLLVVGQNIGARLNIDGRIAINAYFPQEKIYSKVHVALQPEVVHFFILEFFSVNNNTARSVQLLSSHSDTEEFTHLHGSFYNVKVCGDRIPDKGEICSRPDENKLVSDQFTLLDCYTQNCILDLVEYCGNGTGVCMELFPENCFVDCHPHITKRCSATAPMQGHIAPGFHVSMDTLGDLIWNQMMWHLPGIEHIAHGFNIITGEESSAPLFYFGYCGDYLQRAVQDTYRDSFYILPNEVFAQSTPQCSYSSSAKVYSSATKFANSLAIDSASSFDMNIKMGFDLGDWVPASFNVDMSLAMSQEISVSSALNLKQKRSGSIVVTEVTCETSKVQLSKFNLHPNFLEELSLVNTKEDVLPLMKKYGTHFYNTATLGGRLRQMTVLDSSYESTQSDFEIKRSAEISLAASVSGSLLSADASLSVDLAGSLDSSTSTASQSQYEKSTSRSTVITYGGPPGSFGPTTSAAPSNFGDWASSVDLLPVPIDYQLVPIHNAIPDTWRSKNGTLIKEIWKSAEPLFRNAESPLTEDAMPNRYTLYWFYYPLNSNMTDWYITKPNKTTPDLSALSTKFYVQLGTSPKQTIMDQRGWMDGAYAPFTPRLHTAPINNPNPMEFTFSSPVSTFSSMSLHTDLVTSLADRQNLFASQVAYIMDWQVGKIWSFHCPTPPQAAVFVKTSNQFTKDGLDIFFNVEQKGNATFLSSTDEKTFWEFVFFGVEASESRVYRHWRIFTENFATTSNQNVHFKIPYTTIAGSGSISSAIMTAANLGDIKEVTVRLGTQRKTSTGKVELDIKHFWVSNMRKDLPGPYSSDPDRYNKMVFATPGGKTHTLSNYDSEATRIVLSPLNGLNSFQ